MLDAGVDAAGRPSGLTSAAPVEAPPYRWTMMSIESRAPAPMVGSPRTIGAALLMAVGVGLVLGALTAYAQGWLGDGTASLANSAGPWSVGAFVVARTGRGVVAAVVAAMVTLASCEVGYAIATEVRGGSNATSTVAFWLAAALVAGPPLGVAAWWSTRTGVRRAVGFAVLGGVLLGEGWYGWTTVADTTDWRYWAVELSIGVAIVAGAAISSRRLVPASAAVGAAAATALVVLGAGRAV